MSLTRTQVKAFAKRLREIEAEMERVLRAPETRRTCMKAADDFDTIRQRLAELQAEKRRCTGGCGEPIRGYHKEGCKYQGVVVEGETQ